MGETVQNIRLTASGGPEAAAAINGAAHAMANVSQAHDGLEDRFAHRFQHIGLYLFAGEAVRAAGLGNETRQIIGLLNLSVIALGNSLGAAAGPIFLVAAALAALLGIATKVQEHHKTHAADLEKLVSTQDKELKSLGDSIDQLEKYRDKVGHVSQEVLNLLAAKKQLAAFEASEETKNLEQQVIAEQKMIVELVAHRKEIELTAASEQHLTAQRVLAIAVTSGATAAVKALLLQHHDFSKELDENASAILKANVQWKEAVLRLKELEHGIYDSAAAMKQQEEAANRVAEAQKKVVSAIQNLNEKTRQSYSDMEDLDADFNNSKLARIQIQEDRQIAAINKVYDEAKTKGQLTEQLSIAHDNAITAAHAKAALQIEQADNQVFKQFQTASNAAVTNFISAFSTGMAKMFVEGKSFSQEMAHIWRDMAEQFIAAVIRMEIEWAAFQLLTGGAGGGFFGTAFGGAHAAGGTAIVDRPTYFLAGEGGEPEIVNVTPASRAGGSPGGGGQSIQVSVGDVHVHGNTDAAAVGREIAQSIVAEIRGRGNLNFTRSN